MVAPVGCIGLCARMSRRLQSSPWRSCGQPCLRIWRLESPRQAASGVKQAAMLSLETRPTEELHGNDQDAKTVLHRSADPPCSELKLAQVGGGRPAAKSYIPLQMRRDAEKQRLRKASLAGALLLLSLHLLPRPLLRVLHLSRGPNINEDLVNAGDPALHVKSPLAARNPRVPALGIQPPRLRRACADE